MSHHAWILLGLYLVVLLLLVKPFGKDDFYEALKVAFGASDFATLD